MPRRSWRSCSPYFEDLTPFLADPCWMVVLLAKQAPVGVILRRGPTRWWNVTLWDTKRDEFRIGPVVPRADLPGEVRRLAGWEIVDVFRGKVDDSRRCLRIQGHVGCGSSATVLTAALWPIAGTDGAVACSSTAGLSSSIITHCDITPIILQVRYASWT
jgi:hypothetical protein